MSKTRWPLYCGVNIVINQSGARDCSTSNVLLLWRLMVTPWWFTTRIVVLATLRYVRMFAGGGPFEGRVLGYALGPEM